MAKPLTIYVMDSSSWITIEGHPDQNRLRSAITGLIEQGRIKFPPEVWTEIEDTSGLSPWLKPYKDLLLDRRTTDPDYLLTSGLVTHQFPAMAGATSARRNKADPWVIAMAVQSIGGGQDWAVVCNETLATRPNRKMPTACKHFNVPCFSLLEMLAREFPDDGW